MAGFPIVVDVIVKGLDQLKRLVGATDEAADGFDGAGESARGAGEEFEGAGEKARGAGEEFGGAGKKAKSAGEKPDCS